MFVGWAGGGGVLVVHAWFGRWQLTQARLPSPERRGSKKSRFLRRHGIVLRGGQGKDVKEIVFI